MPHIVEGLGTVMTNKGIFANLSGGEQPSAGVNDQNTLVLQSTNEDPLNPGSFLDSKITLNNLGITITLPTDTIDSRFLCKNSDNDQMINIKGGGSAVAVGLGAGINAPAGTTAIGSLAGSINQGISSTAIGAGAGQTNQGSQSIAIGAGAGQTNQQIGSIAIGQSAGNSSQGSQSIAIGQGAGATSQGLYAIAIGQSAGNSSQETFAIAIGKSAGETGQKTNAVAIGKYSGQNNQNSSAIAIGKDAGKDDQGQESIAIGYQSCILSGDAGDYSTSIGSQTKHTGQYGISLGYKAGSSGAVNHSFHIGMDSYVDPSTLGNSCIRPEGELLEDVTHSWKLMAINTVTGEVRFITGLSQQDLTIPGVEAVNININTGEIGYT